MEATTNSETLIWDSRGFSCVLFDRVCALLDHIAGFASSTDPTVPETIIPWFHTVIQDDRVQGYTLARHIYTELGIKRVALLRVNDRYGRFGVGKFCDASRRLGHPVVIEQKFKPGDTDFRSQLQVIAGDMVFDPNCKNIAPLFLGHIHNGQIQYRRITMEKPYAQVGENGIQYVGPATHNENATNLQIGIFGPQADKVVHSPEVEKTLTVLNASGGHLSLIPISSEGSWGKASNDLVEAIYNNRVLAVIALDRNSAHLAEQIGVKAFVPVIAISSDRALTTTNIPWIFRLPEGTPLEEAVRCLSAAITWAGPNRSLIRDGLASGRLFAGVEFDLTGEIRR